MNYKKIIFFTTLSMALIGGGILKINYFNKNGGASDPLINSVFATSAGGTLTGYAWSSNIGWIHFSNPPTYAVDFDSNGNLSGYAWSSNIGWIGFNRTDTSTPPANPIYSNTDAQIQSNGKVYGWARALSQVSGNDVGAFDGWIALGGTSDPNGTGYGVYQNGCNLQGYAWGSNTIGWVSFYSPPYGSSNPTYAVSILNCVAPTLDPSSLAASPTYCGTADSVLFSWNISSSGTNETAYELQVTPSTGTFSSPSYDSGQVSSSSNSPILTFAQMGLQYATTYQWRVRIWDQNYVSSIWYQGPNFTTANHDYPKGVSAFTWDPNPIVRSQPTIFNATNVNCYTTNNATIPCSNYSWLFDSSGPFSTSSATYPYTFTTFGNHTFSLSVTDPSGYSCSGSQSQDVYLSYPTYKEINP